MIKEKQKLINSLLGAIDFLDHREIDHIVNFLLLVRQNKMLAKRLFVEQDNHILSINPGDYLNSFGSGNDRFTSSR